MKTRMPSSSNTYRLANPLPKVGIRPTIDGRLGGVRESLEAQTMSMAQSAAELITRRLRHPDGQKVECVIADTCIGGVAEAAQAAEKFRREGVGVSLTVTPCWCYGTETMDADPHVPKAVWGFNGAERPGAVYLAAVSAGYNQKGLPVFTIYGADVQDAGDRTVPQDVQDKLLRFVRAGLAVASMRNTSYLAVGGVSMGIAGSIVDHDFFEAYLGMRVETVDSTEIVRRIDRKIYDQSEFERAMKWVRRYCKEGEDVNPPAMRRSPEQKAKEWEFSIKMTMIVRDMMIGNQELGRLGFGEEALGHNAIAAGFQGQRQWTDHFPNGDVLEALLCSSFDWNGIRRPFIVATENDALNGATMLFGHLLTGSAQIFADVRTYWSPVAVRRVAKHTLSGRASGGMLHLINSGPAALDGTGQQRIDAKPAMKPFWDISQAEVEECLKATTWHASIGEYFRGGGFSTRFRTRGGMPVTAARINLIRGLGPALQIAEGWTVELPQKVHDVLDRRTNPTWPTTWFVPNLTGEGVFHDVYNVMKSWGANHCAFGYGHNGADLITLASMLRIPVSLHNVEEARIFRPSAWDHFGAGDPIGADFRASANFGPVYKPRM